MLVLVACMQETRPAPGIGDVAGSLIQPVTIEQITWATPAVDASIGAPARSAAAAAQETPDAALVQRGEVLYVQNCAPCHRPNGEGNLDRFPALANNALVTTRSPAPLIRTVLYGHGVMPAFNVNLSDADVAAILSYARSAWGNNAPPIAAGDVEEVEPRRLDAPTPGATNAAGP